MTPLLSNFAFNFNLRHYTVEFEIEAADATAATAAGELVKTSDIKVGRGRPGAAP